MKRLALSIIMIGILSACSNPKDVVIPSDTASWDTEMKDAIKKLSEEDRAAIASYLMRAKVGEAFGGQGIPIGTTIGKAIEEQKDFEAQKAIKRAQEEALKKKLQQERDAVLEKLNSAVTVTLISKRQLPSDYQSKRFSDYQEFTVGIQNNTDKQISGVAGELKFIDIFDKEIGAVTFRVTERISPKSTFTWVGGRDYNQFVKEHRAVWNLEDGDFKTEFTPSMVVFSDGTKLIVPE